MIKSFGNKNTQKVFEGEYVKGLPQDIQKRALWKLDYLDSAVSLQDLQANPGNHLQKLHGARTGQYSIRINKQWRIVFKWLDNNAFNVEIVDYH